MMNMYTVNVDGKKKNGIQNSLDTSTKYATAWNVSEH